MFQLLNEQKLSNLIGDYTKGRDTGNQRIIVKNTDYIESEVKRVLMNSSDVVRKEEWEKQCKWIKTNNPEEWRI